jgi:hypothetical protein
MSTRLRFGAEAVGPNSSLQNRRSGGHKSGFSESRLEQGDVLLD